MREPSGRAVTIRSYGYEAHVVQVGAGLRSLTRDGVDLVRGYAPDEMASAGRGQLLMPWPNRVEDGRYSFDGVDHQLPLTEAARGNAIHGLTRWATWTLDEVDEARAGWSYRLPPQPGYPFELSLAVTYEVGDEGLRVTASATNRGDTAAPYGFGAHPYLTVGRPIDGCELRLPAAMCCPVDDRGLPGTPEPVDGTGMDFREARLIGSVVLDHPFTAIGFAGGRAQVVLRDPDSGREVTLTVDETTRWLQAFSGDTLGDAAREALAVEPMTCPANAFRSGTDLIRLEPGQTHQLSFSIS